MRKSSNPLPADARSQTGHLHIVASAHRGRTVLTTVERSAPYVVGPPSYRAGRATAQVIIQQASPGLLPGDNHDLSLTVGAGARLVVRGQGATKLYPCPSGACARIRTTIRVEEGGELMFLPGELIPFRDAALRQDTHADIAAGGRLTLSEIVTLGRVAMGERDAYRELDLRLRITVGGRLALVERAHLEPRLRPLSKPGRHGPSTVSGVLYRVGIEDDVRLPEHGEAQHLIGVGHNNEGVEIIRTVSMSAQSVHEMFRHVTGRR